jgi:hypothetical protein
MSQSCQHTSNIEHMFSFNLWPWIHVIKVTNNFLNKDNSPTTSAWEDFSVDESTPNMLLFSLIESPNPTTYSIAFIAHAW